MGIIEELIVIGMSLCYSLEGQFEEIGSYILLLMIHLMKKWGEELHKRSNFTEKCSFFCDHVLEENMKKLVVNEEVLMASFILKNLGQTGQ